MEHKFVEIMSLFIYTIHYSIHYIYYALSSRGRQPLVREPNMAPFRNMALFDVRENIGCFIKSLEKISKPVD